MNPILNLLNGGGNNKIAIYMKAIAAMRRGESAESFMANLAKEDSRFQGLDFNNLEKTATDICQQKGVDPNTVIGEVQNDINSLI